MPLNTAKCLHPAIICIQTYTYRGGHSGRRPDPDHLERIRRRSSRAKKKGGKRTRVQGRTERRRREEGTRIWPLQLEERGKAEVANPCKEPLYFLKEVLRAPDALPPSGLREKDRRGPRRVTWPRSSAFIPLSSLSPSCNGHASSTLSARYDDDDDDDVGRIPCRSTYLLFFAAATA